VIRVRRSYQVLDHGRVTANTEVTTQSTFGHAFGEDDAFHP
jgi:hypothetical protein